MKFQDYAPPPTVVTPENLPGVIRHCADTRMLAVDTETLGLVKDGIKRNSMTDTVVVMGLSPDENSRYLVPQQLLRDAAVVLSTQVPKVLSNAKFDAHRLYNTVGIELNGPWVDTVHLDFLIDENRFHGLKECAERYFDKNMRSYSELFGHADPREFRPGHPQWGRYVDYASWDPWMTRKVALKQMDELQHIPKWEDDPEAGSLMDIYWDTDQDQLKVLYAMERTGIKVNPEHIQKVSDSLSQEMEEIATEVNALVGYPINPGSGPQIAKRLFEELGVKPRKLTKSKSRPAVDEEILGEIRLTHKGQDAGVLADLVLRYRSAQKTKGTYGDGLLAHIHTDGRVHTTYTTTMVTGRISSKDPNLQNIPAGENDTHEIRGAFVPEGKDRVFIVADESQLEFRCAAGASGDETLINAINSGLDGHTFTASRFLDRDYDIVKSAVDKKEAWALEARNTYKAIGFGLLYGKTAFGLAQSLGISETEADYYIHQYLRVLLPGMGHYIDFVQEEAQAKGYVQTITGRRRRLPDAMSNNQWKRKRALRQANNAPIQGTAADIIKYAMIKIFFDARLRELGFRLLHQIHDEFILEGPRDTAAEAALIVKGHMEFPFSVNSMLVQLLVKPKIVNNWLEGK